jgi:excisionase family DNA binding protein
MAGIDPIFISVKDAAAALAVAPMTVYRLLDQQVIASQYQGRKRLVLVESLREYAANLPTSPPESVSA